MATNIIRDDDSTMVIEAVGAAYDSGDYIAQGLVGGISLNDVDSGADAVVQYKGEVSYAKTAGSAWTEGDELFFDSGNDEFTNVATTDGIVRGYAAADALLAATSGLVTLCEGHYTAAGAFVTYDNSTSGLAATTVQDAIDEVEDRVDDLESDKMDLVATPTAGNLIEVDATGQGFDSGIATANVVLTNDARLSDARTPSSTLAHAASHATGQADVLTPAAIGAQAVVVAAVENNLASFDAAGSTKDSGIAAASIAGAVTMGGIWNDNMRNSTDTAQSLADATATLIDLEDVELVGDVTYAAGTTSLATIPAGASGIYAIAYELTFAAGAGTYNAAEIYKNGTYYTDTTETPDNANPIFVSDYVIMYLAAGDTIGLWGKQDSGGALNVTSGRLAIQRLQ